jgi:hypothetical protein
MSGPASADPDDKVKATSAAARQQMWNDEVDLELVPRAPTKLQRAMKRDGEAIYFGTTRPAAKKPRASG